MNQAPAWMALSTPNAEHDHPEPGGACGTASTPRAGRGPRRRWARAVRCGSLTGSSRTAATSQVAASTARAQPGPTVDDEQGGDRWGRGPSARRGPSRAARWPAGAGRAAPAAGSSPASRGRTRPTAVPLTASRTTSVPELGVPGDDQVRRQRPATAPRSALDDLDHQVRGSRSAITPPSSRKSTIGTVRAASTWPRAVARVRSRSSTAKASATAPSSMPSDVDGAGGEEAAELAVAQRCERRRARSSVALHLEQRDGQADPDGALGARRPGRGVQQPRGLAISSVADRGAVLGRDPELGVGEVRAGAGSPARERRDAAPRPSPATSSLAVRRRVRVGGSCGRSARHGWR